MKHFIIGTAGHIDHGKTSLIRALTGRNTDRLSEEQKRGITIDLGFTYYDDESGVRVGIVDVPGHEKFVKNMLSGVHGMDLVLVIIAADEGIMPQTVEHLNILNLLGVDKGIIVITKTDMVEKDWMELVLDDVKDYISHTFLKDAPIVPVSSKTGEGIDELKSLISKFVSEMPENVNKGEGVLPVDRVFTLKGVGTVVTGTQTHGEFKINQDIFIYPEMIESKIRSIQVHGEDMNESYSSQRVAMNLANVKKEDIKRGSVISVKDHLLVSNLIDVKLKCIPDAKYSIKNRSRVRFHIGSEETLARVILLDRGELKPGEECYAQLLLQDEIVAMRKDKFIVRFFSPVITIGGGEILELKPSKKKRFREESIELIKNKDTDDISESIEAILADRGTDFVTKSELSKLISLPEEDIIGDIENLEDEGIIETIGDNYLVLSSEIKRIQNGVIEYLEEYHKKFPLRLGVSLEEIRQKFLRGLNQKIQDSFLNRISADKDIIIDDNLVLLSTFFRTYTDAEQKKIDEIVEFMKKEDRLYKKDELDGAPIDLINAMIKDKILIEMSKEVMLYEYYLKCTDTLFKLFNEYDSINVKIFRDELGTNRKTAVALLEYYDAKKITRRQGDERFLFKRKD